MDEEKISKVRINAGFFSKMSRNKENEKGQTDRKDKTKLSKRNNKRGELKKGRVRFLFKGVLRLCESAVYGCNSKSITL